MTLSIDFPSDSSISSVHTQLCWVHQCQFKYEFIAIGFIQCPWRFFLRWNRCRGSRDSSSNCRSSHWIKYVTYKLHTDETAMEKYLSEQPNTILKQSKYSRDRTKKYEYWCCTCGVDFRLLIVVETVNGNAFETRETPVPDNHDPLSEVVNRCHRTDKEVSQMIVELLEQN
jgi:hypothetical protein